MALHSPRNDPAEGTPLRGISLCAGVGGLELGLRIAEPRYKTVCYVERDAHAAAVLVARMAEAALCDAPVWDDVKTFDGRPWRGKVDILSAGYPCQPFSSAGRRLGRDDPRHLWPAVARIIAETGVPRVVLENVEGHVTLGLAEVAAELREMGYRVKAGLFTALECGAPHWRKRLFIVADADGRPVKQPGGRAPRRCRSNVPGGIRAKRAAGGHLHHGEKLDDLVVLPEGDGLDTGAGASSLSLFPPAPCDYPAWGEVLAARGDLEPGFFGLDHGLATGLERPHAAGNGVVPLVAALAYRTLEAA